MPMHYPGTVIEVSKIEKGISRQLFADIFALGGITLSQVCIMTGLEPYLIQNWVKRGFVSPPQKRVYSKNQLARIIIINMLKDTMQIDKICRLIKFIGGATKDESDDLISDQELYHLYVDMLAECNPDTADEKYIFQAVENGLSGYEERIPGSKKQLARILQAMLYAHQAALLRKSAEDIISGLQ